MRMVKIRRGFTLVEVLIAVIVLGILAAMTMISSGSVTDRAEMTACLNDRKVIQKAYLIDKAEEPSDKYVNAISKVLKNYPQATLVYSSDTFCTVSGVCPAHGTIELALSDLTNLYKVEVACSKHTDEISDIIIVQLSNVLSTTKFDKLGPNNNKVSTIAEYFDKHPDSPLDSTGPNYGQKFVEVLSALTGIDMSNYYWQITQTGKNYDNSYKYNITWSTKDITKYNKGEIIPVTRYNTQDGTLKYGTAKVAIKTVDKTDIKYLNNFTF